MTVPTRGDRLDLLAGIVETVGVPPGRIVVVETAPDLDLGLPAGVRRVVDCGPVNIQRWWRRGLNVAESYMGEFVLVLNDDVTVEPDTLPRMLAALLEADADLCWADPEGLTGWAWLLRLASPVRPDCRFAWWFGDNDMSRQARALGTETGTDAGVRHLHANETTADSETLQALAAADRRAYQEKWGTG